MITQGIYNKARSSKKQPAYSKSELEKIRTRAYFIWEKKGKPTAETALDNWLQAERKLRREGVIK